MSKKLTYMEAIANAFSEGKAWRFSTFVLSGLLGISILGQVYQSVRAPSYLVPHTIASAKGPMKVQPGSDINLDYAQYVAVADLGLVLNWNPQTIETQFARFLNRTTPALFSSQKQKLLEDIKKYKAENASQSFYPNRVRISGNSLLKIEGTLVRWNGSKLSFREDYTYVLDYKESGGILYVDNLRIEK